MRKCPCRDAKYESRCQFWSEANWFSRCSLETNDQKKKTNFHISSFLADPKNYQHEKCAHFTKEIINHCSYWISHIKTPIWTSYRLITQSDWKLRKIHLMPINVYDGLAHSDFCYPTEYVGKQILCYLFLNLKFQLERFQSTTKFIYITIHPFLKHRVRSFWPSFLSQRL